jgi:hypothetical protein
MLVDKGKPRATWGRKATGLGSRPQLAGLPKPEVSPMARTLRPVRAALGLVAPFLFAGLLAVAGMASVRPV